MKNLLLNLRERRPRSRSPANSQLPGKDLSQNLSLAEHLLVLVVGSPSNQIYVVVMKPWHRY
ncbi:MAG: hypothetical protein JO170_18915 [Verrucomicrobia bacterium]|nr:hypothetical protein [Verrucomicrobiota bacterium]